MRSGAAGKFTRYRITRKSRPQLEGLEERKLLYATTGGVWSQPQRVTFSFVPDGTSIGGTPSALYSTLNAEYAGWQSIFIQAAAIWEQVANVNLVQVADNGAALGVGSYQQGDPNMGDIRISAIPLGSGVLASTFYPPPINGSSDGGDMLFNSNANWTKGTGYDLLTVAVHELGHALGMGHSAVTTAEMYGYYNAIKPSLTSDDITGIQSIYSTRQPDAWTNTYHNTAMASAADITSQIDSNGQIALGGLDITAATVANWFKVTVPATTNGTATITMQSTNLSELSPKVQIYNSAGLSIGYTTAANAYGATVTYTLTGISAGQFYYVKTGAANSGATGAGGYGLELNFGTKTQAPIAPPNTQVANQPDKGGGSANELIGWGPLGLVVNLLDQITIGTISGYGDDLTVRPKRHSAVPSHHSHHHPVGPAAPAKHTHPEHVHRTRHVHRKHH